MKILLLSHGTQKPDGSIVDGPPIHFSKYLVDKGNSCTMVFNPLDKYKDSNTLITDNFIATRKFYRHNFSLPINILLDFYFVFANIFRTKYDVIISANNLDTLFSSIIKNIVGANKIIYYATDYSERRFKNSFLNWIYILIEKKALKASDFVISNTHAAEKERLKLGLDKSKSLVIHNGLPIIKRNSKINQKTINPTKFIYIGHVSKEHGLRNFLINTKIPMSEIHIIGYGEELDDTIDILRKKGIKYKITNGLPRNEVLNYLNRFDGYGLAPYIDKSWTKYCSPLKVAEYLSNGIPVIISNIPEISKKIKTNGWGLVFSWRKIEKLTKKSISRFDTNSFCSQIPKIIDYYDQARLYEIILKKTGIS